MKAFFEKDSFLKILSFIIAVLLWFYIIAVVDPSVNITIRDIPVRFTNQNLIEERGLCPVNETKITVELKIRGSRKKIANIDNKNVYATADLSNITKTGTFSVPIAINIPYEYDEILNKKPYNASVVIDKIVTETRDVKVTTGGSVAEGYIAGEATAEVKTVKLRGAQTMLDRIGAVCAEINYDDRAGKIEDTVELFFLDKNEKQINKNNIVYSLVEPEMKKITVSCPIYKLKTVPVTLDTHSSNLKENYKVSIQPSNVTIYAENEVLSAVSEIFTQKVNLDDIEETTTVKLVLPESVSLRDGITELSVKVEKRD